MYFYIFAGWIGFKNSFISCSISVVVVVVVAVESVATCIIFHALFAPCGHGLSY